MHVVVGPAVDSDPVAAVAGGGVVIYFIAFTVGSHTNAIPSVAVGIVAGADCVGGGSNFDANASIIVRGAKSHSVTVASKFDAIVSIIVGFAIGYSVAVTCAKNVYAVVSITVGLTADYIVVVAINFHAPTIIIVGLAIAYLVSVATYINAVSIHAAGPIKVDFAIG